MSVAFLRPFAQRRADGILIDTACGMGDVTDSALKAGYDHVYGLESSSKQYLYCATRFGKIPSVRIMYHPETVVPLCRELIYKHLDANSPPITLWMPDPIFAESILNMLCEDPPGSRLPTLLIHMPVSNEAWIARVLTLLARLGPYRTKRSTLDPGAPHQVLVATLARKKPSCVSTEELDLR